MFTLALIYSIEYCVADESVFKIETCSFEVLMNLKCIKTKINYIEK